jgi:cytoskeletal protein CcmA (bactofilin family)
MMRKWMLLLVAVMLFLGTTMPVWADDGSGEVILFGEDLVIRGDETVDGNVVVFGGNVELREGGRVRGDVVCLGGAATIDGRIAGSLVVLGGRVDLQSNAVVSGDLFTLGSRVSRAEGATVRGERIEGLEWDWPQWRGLPERWWMGEPWRWRGDIAVDWFGSLVRLAVRTLALVALGVALVLVFPKQTAQVGQTVTQLPVPSAGVGMLTFVVLLVAVPLLVIICIGIPVVVLLAIAFVAAQLLGRTAIGLWVGERLLQALNVSNRQPVLEVAVGVVLIELLTAVPCIGWLLGAVIALAGLGAVVLTRFGTVPYPLPASVSELPAAPTEPELPSAPGDDAEES